MSEGVVQLMSTAPNDLDPPTGQAYSLLQTHGVIKLRALPIERTE
jgi:hypothetical protein